MKPFSYRCVLRYNLECRNAYSKPNDCLEDVFAHSTHFKSHMARRRPIKVTTISTLRRTLIAVFSGLGKIYVWRCGMSLALKGWKGAENASL